MRKPVIQYTVIAFAITVLWTIVEHVLGYNTTNHEVGQYTRLITAFIYYACVALAIWATRRQQNNTLTFAEGFKTGALVSVSYGLLVTAWFAIYGEIINPQFQPTLMAFERKKLEAANASPEVIVEKLKEVEMSSGGSTAGYIMLFVFMTLFGLIVSVIASFFMKKEKKISKV